MNKNYAWFTLTLLTLVFIVSLALVVFGLFLYLTSDKSGIFLFFVGLLFLIIDIFVYILYFNKRGLMNRDRNDERFY
jgi:hypothetical protein